MFVTRQKTGIKQLLKQLRAQFVRRVGVITHVDTTEPVMALTFDDGPNPEWTPRLLDLLERHRAHATFFVVGEMAARYPHILERMTAAGHAIGNHSWNHPSFTAVGFAERKRQVRRCEATIASHSQKLFRPPFGDLNWRSRLELRLAGYTVIGWSVSSADWQPSNHGLTIADILRRESKPGSIVLLHDQLFAYTDYDECSREPMLAALDQLMSGSQLKFVTVPELLKSGTPRARLWAKESEIEFLRSLETVSNLGFTY